MPPQLANFAFRVVKEVLEAHGLYVLEEFPDGQIMWGDRSPSEHYEGAFLMADYYILGRYDIFTVKALVNSLGKGDKLPEIEKSLYDRIHDE